MRVVFTVALAVAILAVTLPAVDAVSIDRATADAQRSVERLVEAARTLSAGNDALASESGTARQVLSLGLPQNGFASAPLVSLTIGSPQSDPPTTRRRIGRATESPDPAATRVTWRVEGGQQRVEQFDGVRLRPRHGGERFELDSGGTHRLVLRLVSRNGKRVVMVSAGTR